METIDILRAYLDGQEDVSREGCTDLLQSRADELVAQGRDFVLGSLGQDASGY